ncbi:hypothetical protein ACIQJ8_33315 [Streptomyces globisporus]|uniref:hypothetical protein n=1 Tax=Streptomyces globisporus TaxID=1908 RepID=UPI00177BA371|nr:hypothetical protein OG449_35095 [Streptomyces globisporus]GGW17204.1 hypothetical protein GCM10010264_71860 [Streptomyces globisporus]
MEHRDAQGKVRRYDFGKLPVPDAFQRSLAALYAAKCAPGGGWDSIASSEAQWYLVKPFTEFLAGLDEVPQDVDTLTAAQWTMWRLSLPPRSNGYKKFSAIVSLLQLDPRLSPAVREVMAKRFFWAKGHDQAYSPEEFSEIRRAARRTFRSALLRIRENREHLVAWRSGAVPADGDAWLLGEALDVLARTGDVPQYQKPSTRSRVLRRYRPVLGGDGAQHTWKRLHLSRTEVAALAVLITAELGLNSTTVSELPVPRALPGTAETSRPVYRLELEKRRRTGHRGRYESRNITDFGADSAGRVFTEALEATAHARAVVATVEESIDRLLVWHQTTPHVAQAYPGETRVGPFGFGVNEMSGRAWAKSVGLSGAPMRRIRRTVNVLHRREPGQNTQDTHDRVYVLSEPQVREAAVPVIADGALEALDVARRTVFAARLADRPTDGLRETVTNGCADWENSPFTPAAQGCGASFLLCTACPNARVTPAHHPRLAHLLQALETLRGVVEPAAWETDWADAHARLTDLRSRLGAPVWEAGLDAVTATDRALIDQLLQGEFDL